MGGKWRVIWWSEGSKSQRAPLCSLAPCGGGLGRGGGVYERGPCQNAWPPTPGSLTLADPPRKGEGMDRACVALLHHPHHSLDLNGDLVRQRTHADRRARVAAALAQ